MQSLEDKIVEYLKEKREPISLSELSESLNYTRASVARQIRLLQEKGIVDRVGNERYSMWCLSEDNGGITLGEMANLKSIFNDNIADSKGASEELENKIFEVEDKINKIYLHIIEIMGIFVTVFSLVISNAQRIYDASQCNYNICDLIKGILVSNISTVVVIFFLMLFIKLFFGVKKEKVAANIKHI